MLGQLPGRRDARQPRQLPDLRARRDRLQPARRRLRGHRQGLRRARSWPTSTSTWPAAAGWSRSSPSTPARAGSRATCSPAGTACSAATRRSSTSSTRCSTSTPSGSRRRASIEWRPPIASLNYLLTSHVWRQDHNGFSHQDPGFIDHVVNKKAEVVRVYLPPDTNTLLSTMRHCLAQRALRQRRRGRQAAALRLAGRRGRPTCTAPAAWHLGLGLQRRRRPGRGDRLRRRRPDPRGAGRGRRSCASTCPTLKVRFVNVVDLMRLQDDARAPARAVATATSTPSSPPTSR